MLPTKLRSKSFVERGYDESNARYGSHCACRQTVVVIVMSCSRTKFSAGVIQARLDHEPAEQVRLLVQFVFALTVRGIGHLAQSTIDLTVEACISRATVGAPAVIWRRRLS
jgi:hypothetical protein